MTTLKLAVTEFAQKNVPTGDIDERGQLAQVAPELGITIHQKIQKSRTKEHPSYDCEVSLSHSFSAGDELNIDISGRLDGIWQDSDGLILEEIKSSLNVRKTLSQLNSDSHHPYILQTKLYAWMIHQSRGEIPRAHILLVSAGSGDETIFPIEFDPEEFTSWINERIAFLASTWSMTKSFKASRKLIAGLLKFPYPKKREGQKQLLKDVEATCSSNGQLIAQAPTGLGKTAAVMFPLLKSAIKRGDKLFHVTPKNSQLREAEKFLLKLRRKGMPIQGMIMTAKPKICVNGEVNCTPDACKFAKGHYDKVNENHLIKSLRAEDIINQKVLCQYAEKYEVCPYELGRQIMPWMDVVAGDYHYALSPHAILSENAVLPLIKNPKPVLSIDEAHNLAERAIDWYTAKVGRINADIISGAPRDLKRILGRLNGWLDKHVDSASKANPIVKAIDRAALGEIMSAWSEGMGQILEKLTAPAENDPLVSLWFAWLNFHEIATQPEELFFGLVDPAHKTLTLHCVNAGPLIREKIGNHSVTVAFSATLKPFKYHISMCGFDDERVTSREYESPFPPDNRCIIAIPQISTAWKDRPRNTPRIAEVIERVIATKKGNYIAFFPSFELLRQTISLVKADGFEIIEQPSNANQYWTKTTLAALKKRRNILLFAVQGGVLSEGIDLPGDELIGAFIVGPALPMVTPEREERRRIIEQSGNNGFATAYIYPAMARSIQSAGRVVRTPKDRGLIILMDPRFLADQYVDAMPLDWTNGKNSPRDLVSQSILSDINQFWASNLV